MGTKENPINEELHLENISKDADKELFCTKKAFDKSRVLALFEIMSAGYHITIVE